MRIKVAKDMKRRFLQLCVSVAGRSVACSWTQRQREQDPSAIEARSLERIDQDKQCCSGRRGYEHWRLGWRSECEGLFYFILFIFGAISPQKRRDPSQIRSACCLSWL